MRQQQKGVALAIAMILTSATAAIGLSAAAMTLNAERQSSNAAQQADVLAASEAGALQAVAALRALAAAGAAIPAAGVWEGDDIANLGGPFADAGAAPGQLIAFTDRSGFWLERVAFFNDRILISSRASSTTGLGRRSIQITLLRDASGEVIASPIDGTSPNGGAITACMGVGVTGSGRIVSVNSQDPSYAGNDASVYTVGENANISVTGGAAINGPIRATGAVDVLGSSRINGSAVANGNVLITGGSYVDGGVQTRGNINVAGGASVFVGGDAYAGGNVRIEAAQIRGNTTAGGNLDMVSTSARITGNATIAGTANLFANGGGKVLGQLDHGGLVGMAAWQNINEYAMGGQNQSNPAVEAPPLQEASGCDPLDVAQMNDAMRRSAENERAAYNPSGYYDPVRAAYITRHNLEDVMTIKGQPNAELHITGDLNVRNSQQLDFPAGQSLYLRIDGDMRIDGGSQIHIPPNMDVTLVIDGDTNITGNGRVNIGLGSTLTVHTGGKVRVDGAGLVVMDGSPLTTNQSGDLQPRVQIFSDYASPSVASPWDHNSSGFTIAGDSAYYATVYAPFTDASITGSAQITGSLWAQRVKVPGAATINYDVALRDLPSSNVVVPGGPAAAGGALILTIGQWQEL